MNRVIESEEKMVKLGEEFARSLSRGDNVLFCGPLGAGKTTLVRGIVKGLGIAARVNSPTFTLIQVYRGDEISVAHIDCYRIEEDDCEDIGLFELLEGPEIVLMEWGDKLIDVIAEVCDPLRVDIDYLGENPGARRVRICAERYSV